MDNINFLTSGVEADIKAKNIKLACEKLSFMAGLLFEIGRLSRGDYQRWKREACNTIDRIKTLADQLDGNEKVITEGNCDEMICTQLFFEGNMRNDFTTELEGLEVCTRLIESYKNQHLEFHMAVKYEFRGLFYQQMFKKEKDFQKKMEHLVGAEKDLKYASDKFQEIGLWQQALVAGHSLVRIYVTAWYLVKIPFDFVMDSLRHLESVADHERQELSTFGGLAALLQKQKYSCRQLRHCSVPG